MAAPNKYPSEVDEAIYVLLVAGLGPKAIREQLANPTAEGLELSRSWDLPYSTVKSKCQAARAKRGIPRSHIAPGADAEEVGGEIQRIVLGALKESALRLREKQRDPRATLSVEDARVAKEVLATLDDHARRRSQNRERANAGAKRADHPQSTSSLLDKLAQQELQNEEKAAASPDDGPSSA